MTSKFSFAALTGVLLALAVPAFAAETQAPAAAPNAAVSTDSQATVKTDKTTVGTTADMKMDGKPSTETKSVTKHSKSKKSHLQTAQRHEGAASPSAGADATVQH